MDTIDPPPQRDAGPYFPGGERLAFLLLLGAILYATYVIARPVLGPLVVAAAVVSLCHRPYVRLTARLGGRSRLSAVLLVALLLGGVLVPVTGLLVYSARLIAVELPAALPRLQRLPAELQLWFARFGAFGQLADHAAQQLTASASSLLPAIAQRAGGWAGAVGGAVAGVVMTAIIFTVALYFFFVDGAAWLDRLVRLLPLPAGHARGFFGYFQSVSVALLVGGFGTSAVQWLVSGVGYWIFGIPSPMLWGLITGIAAFVPVVGSALVWLPLVISLLVAGEVGKGVMLAGYGALVISFSDNLIRPILTQLGMPIHPLLVFVAVFGGLASQGPKGLLIGPMVMAMAVAGVTMYERDGMKKEGGS